METVILACRTIEEELKLALKVSGVDYPVYWVASGLHEKPCQLHETIQEQLDLLTSVSTVLLAFGYCGMALQGVKSRSARLVLPRVDDCISLLLGSATLRKTLSEEEPTYFFTKGWLDYERNLVREYDYCVQKYGQERGKEIMKRLLKHYKRLIVIDTGAYDHEDCLKRIEDLSEALQLERQVVKGSLHFLEKLLKGPWDDNFIIVEPEEEIVLDYSSYSVL